ncbi:MAG: flagellar basal body P-ring protein FlgI [Phycisphaerae bacterium]
MNLLRGIAVLTLTILFTASGCMTPEEWDRFWNKDKHKQPNPAPSPVSSSPAIRDTIAPLVTLQGMRVNRVRGFGLVVDLIDTGGSDGPEIVKNYLMKEIRRKQQIGRPGPAPLEMINSRDTTMVEIVGDIPAGAQKGDRFDVRLATLGSETTSLVGGRLFLGELKVYAETPSGVLGGKTLATAEGPVFVSPFNRHGEPTDKVNLKKGALVLGGGIVQMSRDIRLVLNDPSFSNARRMEQQLNARFATDEKVALAERASQVSLKFPPEYHDRKWFFLERVLHTPMNSYPAFLNQRTRDLINELEETDADYNAVGLTLEAIGKNVLPRLKPLYSHASAEIAYYAARTGLRLEDRDGLDIVAQQARDPKGPFRREAIAELGWAIKMYAAGEHLRRLLDDPDDEIRIAAYQALRRRNHPTIETKVLDEDNAILDIIDSRGSYLIYVQRSRAPRIALFGKTMRIRPPAMFPADRIDSRRLITQISAQGDDNHLTFIYWNKRNRKMSPKLEAPMSVAKLIAYLGDAPRKTEDGTLTGFAVPYSEIIDILSAFCETRTIPAKFVVEPLENARDRTSNEREETEF